MDEFSLTINISAPPTAVFAFLANPPNMTRWYDAVEQVSPASAPHVAKGFTFQIIRSLPGGRAVNKVEITEYEPDRRVTRRKPDWSHTVPVHLHAAGRRGGHRTHPRRPHQQ